MGDNVNLYDEKHLTYIILYFPDVWNFTLPYNATAEDITSVMRHLAKVEIIELMVCMYILPPESLLKIHLNANFGNMASNQRIVEMLHSFVRSFYNAQQPIEFLESKLGYMMDQEFTDREERRSEEKDRRGPDQEYRQIKHLDTKAKCLLQGEQMRKGSEPYTREEIARLAHNIQEEIKVRKLKSRGTTEAEKKYKARLHTALEGKLSKKESRGRSKRLDFATQQEKADKAQTDHNRDWNDKDSRKYSAIVSKVATKGHFNKCGTWRE